MDDEMEAQSKEMLNTIVEAMRDLFDSLAPPPACNDLHTLLFPAEYSFKYQTVNGQGQVTQIDNLPGNSSWLLGPKGQTFNLQKDKECNVPTFSTKKIQVLHNPYNSRSFARVLAGNKEMWAKIGESESNSTQREIDYPWKITSSRYADVTRVPKLLGLIKNPDNNHIIGFLEEYIPVSPDVHDVQDESDSEEDAFEDPVEEMLTLQNMRNLGAIAGSRRAKWALLIKETVRMLHYVDIIWGDGKAGNVLIHSETDDAWVVDFGGGWTEAWVNKDIAGTLEGDEIAIKKMFQHLGVVKKL